MSVSGVATDAKENLNLKREPQSTTIVIYLTVVRGVEGVGWRGHKRLYFNSPFFFPHLFALPPHSPQSDLPPPPPSQPMLDGSILLIAVLLLGALCVAEGNTAAYIDCFIDGAAEDLAGPTLEVGVTVQHCLAFCSKDAPGAPFLYFGLRAGRDCVCGESYGSNGATPTGCDKKCLNNPSQMCGGFSASSVYRIVYPSTPSPPTPAPATFAPTTVVPVVVVSEVPETEAPITPTTAPIVTKSVQTATTVVSALSATAGGFSVGSAMRLALISSGCSNGLSDMMHPTGLVFYGSQSAGAVVADAGITAVFALFCLILHKLTKRGKCGLFGVGAQSLFRLPSAPLYIFQFFFQGMTLAGMNLLIHPDIALHGVLGASVIFICIAVPCGVIRVITRDLPLRAHFARAINRQGYIKAVLGTHEWVNSGETRWVQRYTSVVREYRAGRVWYLAVEFSASFALSALKSTEPETMTGCGHVAVTTSFIFTSLLVLGLWLRPYAKKRDLIINTGLSALQAISMLLVGIGFYGDTDMGTTIGGHLLSVSLLLIMVKVVLDVFSEGYVILSGRRTALESDVQSQFKRQPSIGERMDSNASLFIPAYKLKPPPDLEIGLVELKAIDDDDTQSQSAFSAGEKSFATSVSLNRVGSPAGPATLTRGFPSSPRIPYAQSPHRYVCLS